jgi:hypothetical protein
MKLMVLACSSHTEAASFIEQWNFQVRYENSITEAAY